MLPPARRVARARGRSRRGDLDKRIMHQLQVPAPGRRKRARPLGTGQKDPEFEKFRGASARLVQVRSSEHVRKDEIQRPQDDADRRMLGYPFDWGHVHRAGIAKYHRCSIPDAPGSNACRYLCGPGSGLRGAVCMSGPSSGPIGWGGTLAGFRTSQSPHATIWIVRGAGIGDHRTEWTSADR